MNSAWTRPEDIDQLIAESHPDEVLECYSYPLPKTRNGNNYRLPCPVEECNSDQSSYGKLSVELNPPFRIKCFSCDVRGNLLDLMWIHKHQSKPTGGKLRGDQFKEMLADLKQIREGQSETTMHQAAFNTHQSPTPNLPQPNTPMCQSPNERTRAQANLWERGTFEPAEMPPAASRYFRKRPFLSPEVCQAWGISYITGKSTMRGRIVYRIDDVQGRALAYAGRDPDYDTNLATWKRTGKGKEPIKTRFPSEEYFRRGLELYGQQKDRLADPAKLDLIQKTSIWVVEGFNDVLNLGFHGQPALGAMSNRMTAAQIEKIVRFVNAVKAPGVAVGFDRDAKGAEGQKETIAALSKHVPVIDLWGDYEGNLTEPEQWDEVMVRQAQESAKSKWRRT